MGMSVFDCLKHVFGWVDLSKRHLWIDLCLEDIYGWMYLKTLMGFTILPTYLHPVTFSHTHLNLVIPIYIRSHPVTPTHTQSPQSRSPIKKL